MTLLAWNLKVIQMGEVGNLNRPADKCYQVHYLTCYMVDKLNMINSEKIYTD